MADLATDVLGAMPEASEAAIEAEERREAEVISELRDKHGRSFNPDLHVVDAAGNPVVNKVGGLLKIRPDLAFRDPEVRARANAARRKTVLPGAPVTAAGGVPRTERDFKPLAIVTVETLTGLASMLLGEDWKPEIRDGVDERVELVKAWEAYYRAKGVSELPPEAMLALTMGGYVLPRLQRESMKAKLAKLAKRWGFKRAQPIHGPDGLGENYSRDLPRA
jgi:hypothetical protein